MEKRATMNSFLGFFLLMILCCLVPFPAEPILIDCSPSDTSSSINKFKFDISRKSRAHAIDPLDSERPQISACIFRKKVTCTFEVPNGPKFIRLYFRPISYPGLTMSKALFSVSSGRYTLLTRTSHDLDSDYAVREFCVNAENQALNLTLTPSSNTPGAFAFLNKIEVLSMPSKLYIQERVPLPLIGSSSFYSMEILTALEMMHRLNIGGDFIPDQEDTGFSRSWLTDDGYFRKDINGKTIAVYSEVTIKWSSITPAYTAPAQVYTCAKMVVNSDGGNHTATWLLPVEFGFYYLVRLHFCEICRTIKQGGQRVFQVYVDNQTAEHHFDVFNWCHGSGIPVYMDYIVNFSQHDRGIKYLSIGIGSINGTSSTARYGPILNGMEIFKLSDSSNNLAGSYPFGIREKPYPHASKLDDHDGHSASMVNNIVIGSMMGILLLCCLSLFILKLSDRTRKGFWRGQSTDLCPVLSISEIKSATDNFADSLLIGTGGFGMVYKGYIGTTIVAIKRADPSSNQGLREFKNEICLLSKLRHCHLVSLIGYSMEDNEMILVYDYMARGTLRDHLCRTNKSPLQWKQRLNICIGAARGLHYLHTGSKNSIIDRDIKSTNILLDDKWVAKVSDFGLSKVGPRALTPSSKTHVSTIVKGSFGYLDPEYFRRQKLTEKSDVYSFGVVLLEVLCARPAVMPTEEIEDEEYEKVSLVEWALHCYRMGNLIK